MSVVWAPLRSPEFVIWCKLWAPGHSIGSGGAWCCNGALVFGVGYFFGVLVLHRRCLAGFWMLGVRFLAFSRHFAAFHRFSWIGSAGAVLCGHLLSSIYTLTASSSLWWQSHCSFTFHIFWHTRAFLKHVPKTTFFFPNRRNQRDLRTGIPAWVPKPDAQKSFLVHYILCDK